MLKVSMSVGLRSPSVSSNLIVINEVRNDTSTDNVDWVELKNIGSGIQQIKDWELSIVTKEVTDAGLVVLKDTDLVDLPEYELASGEILLLLNEAPWVTPIAAGVNAADVDSQQREGAPAYVVDSRLKLPNTGKFMLLIRSKFDQNGKDKDIQDYAGNGFFPDFSDRCEYAVLAPSRAVSTEREQHRQFRRQHLRFTQSSVET